MKKFITLLLSVFIFINQVLLNLFAAEIEPQLIQVPQSEWVATSQTEDIKTTSYAKKCFMSLDEHMANILSPNADNVAFAVGMLNPFNAIITIIASPLILLFWPLKTLK